MKELVKERGWKKKEKIQMFVWSDCYHVIVYVTSTFRAETVLIAITSTDPLEYLLSLSPRPRHQHTCPTIPLPTGFFSSTFQSHSLSCPDTRSLSSASPSYEHFPHLTTPIRHHIIFFFLLLSGSEIERQTEKEKRRRVRLDTSRQTIFYGLDDGYIYF